MIVPRTRGFGDAIPTVAPYVAPPTAAQVAAQAAAATTAAQQSYAARAALCSSEMTKLSMIAGGGALLSLVALPGFWKILGLGASGAFFLWGGLSGGGNTITPDCDHGF